MTFLDLLRNTEPEKINQPVEFLETTFYRINRTEDPHLWASASLMCGLFLSRLLESSNETFESAMKYFKLSLEVFKLNDEPEGWAQCMTGIAYCYINQKEGNRKTNVEYALFGLQHAIPVFNQLNMNDEVLNSYMELGSICYHEAKGIDSQYLMKAETFYKEGLKHVTIETKPITWAYMMVYLGEVYLDLVVATNSEKYYKDADSVFSKVVHEFSSNNIFTALGRDHYDIMVQASNGLYQIDQQSTTYEMPLGFENRKYFGQIVFLRPIKTAGKLYVSNQFSNLDSFTIKYLYLPNTLTIESILNIALCEKVSIKSVGGRLEGLGSGRAHSIGGESWKITVNLLMDECDVIMLIPDNSQGLKWEIETIIERKIIHRSIFIMPPSSPEFNVKEMWLAAEIMMKTYDLFLPAYDVKGLIFRFNSEKKIEETIPFAAVWENTLFERIEHLFTQ